MSNVYKKLAGGMATGRLSTANTSLWMGPDHLLLAERDGYSENYKRFYFADIESVVIRKTNRKTHFNIVFGVLFGIMAVYAIANTGFARGMGASVGAVFAILIGLNEWFGPTCTAHILSAVQREEMPSLTRVKKAERILRQITEAIAPVQAGVLTAEEVRQRYGLGSGELEPPPIQVPPLIEPPPPIASEPPSAVG
jgi:hypothetical protein